MIRPLDRKIAVALVQLKVWRLERGMFRTIQIRPRKGSRWIYNAMKRRQAPEDRPYHHAPACPANRWAETALVLHPCNCGAVKHGVVSTRPSR